MMSFAVEMQRLSGGYAVFNVEVASFSSFRDVEKNHFVTAAAKAAADMGDSIKRKRICVSLNTVFLQDNY